MGFDKSSISFHGSPQKEHVFHVLSFFCPKVYSSIGRDANPSDFKNPIPDSLDIDSPLNGILSAFLVNAEVAWLTVPVDMPCIDEKIIRTLLSGRDKSRLATCFFDSTGRQPEPLVTIWESAAAEHLRKFTGEGNISPRDFLARSDVKILPSPGADVLRNINTPDELRAFEKSRGKF